LAIIDLTIKYKFLILNNNDNHPQQVRSYLLSCEINP
jgi:hypothetical protein